MVAQQQQRDFGRQGQARARRTAVAQFGPQWTTDWDRAVVDLGEIYDVGPARTSIPVIDEPRFTSLAEAEGLYASNAPMAVLALDDDVRLYPVEIRI